MGRMMISVEESFAAWRKDSEYEKGCNALEDEFTLAAAMIEARARAGLTQTAAGGAHAYDAGGDRTPRKRRVEPSTRTLERLAATMGLRLRISFEPTPTS